MDKNQPIEFTTVMSLEGYVEKCGEIADDSVLDCNEEIEGNMNLDRILMLLDLRQQAIVLMKMVGYKKHREIASILCLSLSTVEKEVRKIRERIEEFRKGTV